ncbi:DUF2306 domain-containing protein [Geodermatophilus sp. URMC 62]|uniref:DUF2306 domain-containing protein n=1 Tax=Geodermatophilus sp. URMC 62 TaxID=3423414 RepID=UPI00406CA483
MTVPALLIAAYAVFFLVGTPPGDPHVKASIVGTPWGIIHVLGSLVAMAIGPFQFLDSVRRRRPLLHRYLGRLYLFGVATGGVGALWVAKEALSYPVGDLGFALLAAAWLTTGWLGYRSIRHRDVRQHRRWMVRNYALTYAAVMLRWQLPLLIVLGLSPALALTVTGFSAWLPNLLFAEWWLRRRTATASVGPRASAPALS